MEKSERKRERKTPEVKNIDEYEREKIENTLGDAEQLVSIIKNYLKMAEFADEKGISLKGRTSLEKLRYPGGPAGPDSDLKKIASMFESGQKEITRNLTKAQVDEINSDIILSKKNR